ncbi:threonine-phosphate decarboxylase CobD [Tumebacillus permanentifrigoris]|uniref:threonine-phosphate decarboxylase n=1 Tax=Tumebacillus permanentifrigoris TaxID=378543 RepID=A0A316DF07_9BACL|nr:threonine-phosphate decarboxylase CobD [Tumebacillus permanentifrigoris]PWK14824.1 L-threonine O-3-phosphate decarboxylase [Tumebacillus permanentifrigoris]
MTPHIEKFGHGGDLWTAEESLGVPRAHLLDFSANINPLGPPDTVWQGIRDNLSTITAYPDLKSRALKQALSTRYQRPVQNISVGNGAAEILYGILRTLQPQTVGLIHPCFSEYAEASDVVGAKLHGVYAREEADFLPAREELLDACEQVDLFIVGYPNNPNGRLLPIDWLRVMAQRLQARDRFLLVDEAFLDFLPGASTLLPHLEEFPNVILLRSMTKFYSIPGLRLGFAFASPELTVRIERELSPWSVNSLASVAGIAGLQDHEFESRTVQWLREERPFLEKSLQGLPSVKTYGGEVNFILFRSTTPNLQERTGRHGVLIRSCAGYPGLGPAFYRVAVRSRAENLRLLTALQQAMTEEGMTCRTP